MVALTTTQAVPTTTLAAGTAATAFTPVTASGGTAPLSYAVSPTLSAGLSFNTSTGQITGTPTAASVATTYTVAVTDSTTPTAQTSSKTFSLTVTGADMSVDLSGLPTTATVGTAYIGTIKCTNSASASAAATNATCSIIGLPAGLTLGACSPVPPASVAPGASIMCSVSGMPTGAGSARVNVTTSATNDPNTANNTGTATINAIGTPGLMLTTSASPKMFSGIGQTVTFAYNVVNSGNVTVTGLSVTDTKVSSISCAVTVMAPGVSTTCTGVYTTAVADVNATIINSVATARGTFAGAAVTSAAVTTTVKIDIEAVRRATKSAIQGFMSQRANLITSMSPDTGQFHNKLSGWLFGGALNDPNLPNGLGGPRLEEARLERPTTPGSAASGLGGREALAGDRDILMREAGSNRADRPTISAFGFSGMADDGAGRFAFSTSLAKVRAAAAAEEAQKEIAAEEVFGRTMVLGARGPARVTSSAPSRFDVWTEGAFSYYRQDRLDGKRQGHAGIFFAGTDYLVAPGLLVGALVQVDWMDETSSMVGRNANGRGWMAGPYVSARLTQNLFFDARALWGRSNNHVDPLGAYTDSFDTNRASLSAKLTGRWAHGALTFQPSAEMIYFTEQQEAFTNAIGIAIDNQSIVLGRVTFGPEVGYRLAVGDGSVIEPFVGLKGVWDFAKTNETTAAGEPVGRDPWHGRIETGATFRAASGLSVRALGSYHGIGDSHFHAWQGRAALVIPLQ